MNKKLSALLLAAFLSGSTFAQTIIPAPAQSKNIIIQGGTFHLGNGQVVQNGELRIEKGKITALNGSVSAAPQDWEVIKADGKHIYPGLILMADPVGLNEIDAVRQTNDNRETGDYTPHVRSLIAYNTDSEITPTLRQNGILLAQATPQSGLVSGRSSVVQLDAWNWEDAAYKTDEGIHVFYPAMFTQGGWWGEPEPFKRNERGEKTKKELEQFFQEAAAYNKSTAQITNLKFAAMKGLFDGSMTLYIYADFSKDIIEAVEFGKRHGIKKIVVVGAGDAWQITDFLKSNNIAVVVRDPFQLPTNSDTDIDMPFKLPSILQKAGILYSLANSNAMYRSRNLPFGAGMAAGFGLSKEEALMAITSNPAKILGIDDRTGTLEVGKDANILISEGDLLDMRTSKVTEAFIQGRKIELKTKQTELEKKYNTKYGIK